MRLSREVCPVEGAANLNRTRSTLRIRTGTPDFLYSMGDQPTDLWEERALPILRYIAAHETDMRFISIGSCPEPPLSMGVPSRWKDRSAPLHLRLDGGRSR